MGRSPSQRIPEAVPTRASAFSSEWRRLSVVVRCRGWLALLLAAVLCGAARPAPALEPPRQIAQYAHTAWTARDGALLGLVFAMAQTPDGYLWIAGSYGLFRFDGLRFTSWKPPGGQTLPSGPYSLLVSRDGTLWIGTFSGLSSWDGKTFVYRHEAVGKGFVTSLLEDRDGTVWAGVRGDHGRLCAVRAGQVSCTEHEGRFGKSVWSLFEDREGALWVGSEDSVWRWRPGPPQRHAFPGRYVGDLTGTVDGAVLAGLRSRGLQHFTGQRFEPYRFKSAAPGVRADPWMDDAEVKSNKLLRDRDGGLWIGTEGLGLVHVKDGLADTFTRGEGLSGNIACSLFEDREGNIWYGSDKGIDRFRKLPITLWSRKQGLPGELVNSVLAASDGTLWVATDGGLARWKDGLPVAYTERDGLPDRRVQSLHEDPAGRLWVGTARGLARLDGTRFVAVAAGPSDQFYAMASDPNGDLWVSGNHGLARLHRGRLVEHRTWESLGRSTPAHSLITDRGGLVMTFLDGTGVWFYRDGRAWVELSTAEGLGTGYVAAPRLDADGVLWVPTGSGGLNRVHQGRVTALGAANGLPCDTARWSTVDDQGSLWVAMSCGLARVPAAEVAAWIADPGRRVAHQLWTSADGMQLEITPAGYFNPPFARRPDGKLWFVAGSGLQSIDPADMPSNGVPPPVHIDALVADGRRHAAADGLRLPPSVRDLSFEFAALTLADPQRTRFRYRLEGHDAAWQDVVDRRVASYTNLPPGQYRFHVAAANNSGVWNEAGAQMAFSIQPALHQTTTFRVAAAVLLVALVWIAVQLRLRLRVRRLQREFETTLEARVAERTRIARDLHDTLLQRFHGLLLQFQAAFNLLPDRPRDSKTVLARAIDQVAEAITESRDTLQALRATPAEAHDLADALRSLGQDVAREGGGTVFTGVQVDGDRRPLDALLRDEAVRIAGEALRNAFRHARARHVGIELVYGDEQLIMTVRDDGEGIAPDVLRGGREGHFGLSGMRERAALVGGTLTLRSTPGTGTEAVFSAPASRAYSRSAPLPVPPGRRPLSTSEVGP